VTRSAHSRGVLLPRRGLALPSLRGLGDNSGPMATTNVPTSPREAATPYAPRRFSLWRTVYGTSLYGLFAFGLVATALQLSHVYRGALSDLKLSLSYVLPQALILILFSLAERIIPAAGPRKPLRGYILNIKLNALNYVTDPLLLSIVGAGVVVIGSQVGLGLLDLRFSTGHGIGILALAFLLNLFFYDFFYYWFHRFQHENLFLWQEHKLHHLDEQLCAVNRQSPLEETLRTTVIVPLALLFKLDPIQGMILTSVGFAWTVFFHSNIRVPLGWATVLLSGPQVHRIHHSRLPEHRDKNYSAYFPIWDVIFGTYHHPQRDEYPPTGVHDEQEVANFSAAVMLPARAWWQMFHEWRRRQDPVPP
jgi:sterol desaturase/sphingolipid hydroxylase (fatty acid hydroxylase superfamily)